MGDRVRSGLTAAAAIVADRAAGRPRIRWTHAWPVVLRPTGPHQVHLVHGAGGPLGGDALTLDVRVDAAAALAVRSAGATIVQPGRGAEEARWATTATVGPGAALDWAPEPTVVTDGAAFATSLRVDLVGDACARMREIVVLGRHGQRGGRYRGRIAVTVDGAALLVHETRLDGSDPVRSGLGGTAGARAIGSLVIVDPTGSTTARLGRTGADGRVGQCGGVGQLGRAGTESGIERPEVDRADDPRRAMTGERPGVRWAWSDLDGPGRVLLAVGDPGAVMAVLDAASAA